MKSLKLQFTAAGATLLTDALVEDREATIQACLVNFATFPGTDPAHPTRGTNLLKRAVAGMLLSSQEAMHACNFAAIDTVFFVRAHEHAASLHDKVTVIMTKPAMVNRTSLQVDLQFTFASGATIGVIQPLQTNE